jgi:hypothetical protein
MIKCFIALCLVGQANVCQPEMEITPIDHPVTSPMECARGGLTFYSQVQPGDKWFWKVRSFMEGDGSDIVRKWVEDEKARAARLEPQIK